MIVRIREPVQENRRRGKKKTNIEWWCRNHELDRNRTDHFCHDSSVAVLRIDDVVSLGVARCFCSYCRTPASMSPATTWDRNPFKSHCNHVSIGTTRHHSSRSRTDDPINESTSRHSKGKLHQRRTPSFFQPFFFFGSAILALEHFFLWLPTQALLRRQVPPPLLSTGGLKSPKKTLLQLFIQEQFSKATKRNSSYVLACAAILDRQTR
jgi:hypothetical protein